MASIRTDMKTPPKQTEHDIQKEILDYLEGRGVFHWRNNTGRRGNVSYGYPGSPDIICIYRGRFIGIEVKDDTGVMSDAQKEFMRRCIDNGGTYLLARDLATIKRWFE